MHHAKEWKRYLLDARGLQNATVSDYLFHIRAFYRRLIEMDILAVNPFEGVKEPPRRRRSITRFLSQDEARAFLAAATEEAIDIELLMRLMLVSGLRRGEALGARVENLLIIEGRLCLTVGRDKTSTLDTIHLPTKTAALAIQCRGSRTSGYLVRLNPRFKRHTQLPTILKRICLRAGLDVFGSHVLRTTFVTLSLDAGIGPRDVMASAGHNFLHQTQYYDRGMTNIRRNAGPRLEGWLDHESGPGSADMLDQ